MFVMVYNTVQCCTRAITTIGFNIRLHMVVSLLVEFLCWSGSKFGKLSSGRLEVWWDVLVAFVLVSDILGVVSKDLKFYKIQAKQHCVNEWSQEYLVYTCVNNPSTGSKLSRNFSFYSGNLPWYALISFKFQVCKINTSHKNWFLR